MERSQGAISAAVNDIYMIGQRVNKKKASDCKLENNAFSKSFNNHVKTQG